MAFSRYAVKVLLRLAFQRSVYCQHCKEVYERGEKSLIEAVEGLETHTASHFDKAKEKINSLS